MPVRLNILLSSVGLDPAGVRLLRHKERAAPGCGPYELWRDDPPRFETYQARQGVGHRAHLGGARHWAGFVVTPADDTLFVGIWEVLGRCLIEVDEPRIQRDEVQPAGTYDLYNVARTGLLKDVAGRLVVDWGPGTRAWIQRAERQDKEVLEIRRAFQEPEFPGYQRFVEPLSRVASLPKGWEQALRASRGVYLLTCPRTREQYVGSASGEHGFLGRWLGYLDGGDGGNVGLKSRQPSDYQVSILEVAGSAASVDDLLRMEALWNPANLSAERSIPSAADRALVRVRPDGSAGVVSRRGDRQQLADRLDPVRATVIVDERDHGFERRSSSATAKYADAFRRISLAWRSSRFSRSSALMRSRSSLDAPGPWPRSRSAWRTHFRSVSAVQPILPAIEPIVAHCDA
jgi:hypothetical protein